MMEECAALILPTWLLWLAGGVLVTFALPIVIGACAIPFALGQFRKIEAEAANIEADIQRTRESIAAGARRRFRP